AAAAGRTSGSQNAAANFALNPYDTNPQGIADPPTPGSLAGEAAVPPPVSGARPPAFADPGRDRLFETSRWAEVASFLLGEAGRRVAATVRVPERGADGVASGNREEFHSPEQRPEFWSPTDNRVLRDRVFTDQPFRGELEASGEEFFAALLD